METHAVAPDILDSAPTGLLQVAYPSGVEVQMGNELTPTQVKDQPSVTWAADPAAFYTLCMTDPDAPSRVQPQFREILHWLVVNIPGARLDQGDCVAAYRGSGPPRGSGLHRYVFLLYKQKDRLKFDEPRLGQSDREGRRNFSSRKLVAKYGLEPVAGNLYQAQWDEYADIARGQCGRPVKTCSRLLSQLPRMEKAGVVPDVIAKAPGEVLKVAYPSGVEVQMGNELTPTQVKDQPSVTWAADPAAFYTLCMTDPDAPSREKPKFREWHHWLVGNIPGHDVAQGDTLSEYVGSGPPKGTGLHRYVFLVYKQPGKLQFEEARLTNRSGDHRGQFSIKKFAAKYKLGDPVAGNFYQAQWDEYVPKLYEQLSGK
ncbi:uncharacterized protein LOC134541808 [Bacillus rossius redtenbacheri]|uniref:uncharacterized protein LOC134541808 n=1 Tax=Bacillus rossius redtenbacheri TaxID=93214 RepID=UPI002FDC85AF